MVTIPNRKEYPSFSLSLFSAILVPLQFSSTKPPHSRRFIKTHLVFVPNHVFLFSPCFAYGRFRSPTFKDFASSSKTLGNETFEFEILFGTLTGYSRLANPVLQIIKSTTQLIPARVHVDVMAITTIHHQHRFTFIYITFDFLVNQRAILPNSVNCSSS